MQVTHVALRIRLRNRIPQDHLTRKQLVVSYARMAIIKIKFCKMTDGTDRGQLGHGRIQGARTNLGCMIFDARSICYLPWRLPWNSGDADPRESVLYANETWFITGSSEQSFADPGGLSLSPQPARFMAESENPILDLNPFPGSLTADRRMPAIRIRFIFQQ
jgi:hypothetical protein